jgi:uncharacterized protein (TIGR02996 family)
MVRVYHGARPRLTRYAEAVVPGMLVYVDPVRLAALRGAADVAAERWTIRRGDLLAPDLLRPPDWSLYVVTLRADRARVIAYLEHVAADRDELGDATLCDVDITPVLERLGCSAGIGGFPAWARSPRVLTPTDSDLLRYRLGLPLDLIAPRPVPPPPPAPPPPAIGFVYDRAASELLAAVHDDLASDTSRTVLADRLLELGDPRGELIALQLARARAGAPATPRERELIAQHGHAWTKPLSACLAAYGFRRGFLATAVVDDRAMMQPVWYEHPLWATVEELETRNPTLLFAPSLRSLRRVAIPGALFEALALQEQPLAIEAIVGTTVNTGGPGKRPVQGGVELPLYRLEPIAETTMLERVHSMSISIDSAPRAEQADYFLGTRLGMRLQHIELFNPHLASIDPAPWRRAFERNQPLSLGLRGVVDDWIAVVVRRRGSIVLQLGDPARARLPNLEPIMPVVAYLGRGLGAITLERVGEDRFGIDLQPALASLRRVFPTVELGAVHRWRSP